MSVSVTPTAYRMTPSAEVRSPAARWTGRILTGLVIAFFLFDAAIKIFPNKQAIEGTLALGYQLHHLPIIGTLALCCLIVYAIPRTAPLGAILLTGYLGGALASQLRVDNPLFSNVLFPVYFAAILWTALYLRDSRVRALVRPARQIDA
jgi:hypothetical protein